LLIPVRNAKALAAAIIRLGDDPETRHRMAQAGRQKAEAEYDERRIVETVIDTYCDVARRKGLHLGIHTTSGVDHQDAEPADAASGRR
jgi:hypothetical protein